MTKRFADSFAEEARVQSTRLDKTASLISKVMMGKALNKEQIPRLLKMVDKQVQEATDLTNMGVSCFEIAMPAKKRRKTGKQ